MYIQRSNRHRYCGESFCSTAQKDDTKVYHPLSYYVLGGIDVTGEGLTLDAPVSYDSMDDLEAAVGPDSRCDPRVSFFDIAEDVGIRSAKAAEESKQ